jgi:hypothetical protein
MATFQSMVANPTSADVTVNAKTAVANAVTALALDDAVVTEYNGFLAAGCAILRNTVGTESQRQQAGYLLHMEEYVA